MEVRVLGGGAIQWWIPWNGIELIRSADHGPSGGATGSSRDNQDPTVGCVASIGDHRHHETVPQPGPYDLNGEGTCRRMRPQAPIGRSEEVRRVREAGGSRSGLSCAV
jgi:hypothetical protein